jgi:hypothetical protein
MKRLIFSIILLSCTVPFADVPESTLLQAAEAFRAQQFSERVSGLKGITACFSDDILIGYLAEYEPEGFALFRADTNAAPVKIYSETGEFNNLPPDFISVIKIELNDELQAIDLLRRENRLHTVSQHSLWDTLINSSTRASILQLNATGGEGVPLLSTTWNQDANYNLFCPLAPGGPGGRAYAGCVATAVAQVMKYHNHPPQGEGIKIYEDKSGSCRGWHTGDFGSTYYDWSNMPANVRSSTDYTSRSAVNLLIYHAGIAVLMDYEATGSGSLTSRVPDALRDYFRYDCIDVSGRPGGSSYDPWYTRIKNEIDKNRPAYYSFIDENSQIGHAVVCDGYRNGSDIHLNMGWGGSGNAWYNLNDVSYGNYEFNSRHQAVFGICPEGELDDSYEPNDNRDSAHDISKLIGQWLSETEEGPGIQANEDWFTFTLSDVPATLMITCAFDNAEGNIELALYHGNEKLTESRTDNDGESITWFTQAPGTYYIHVDSYNTPGYPYVKVYWLNEYDLMYTIPEGGMFAGLCLLLILWRGKVLTERN